MAKGLIEIALQLGSKLGANTSKFLGTRSNVSFLGTGPKDGMLFQKSIDPESFATIGIEKVIPDIESSLAYATANKLNDIELSTLIKNLKTMDETINPTNVLEMGSVSKGLSDLDELNFTRDAVVAKRAIDNSPLEPGTGSSEFGRESYKNMDEFLKSRGDGGIDSLRAKSGLGERQATEAAASERPINRSGELTSVADEPGQAGLSYAIKNPANIPEATSDIKALNETLTQNETKYFKELIEDTGGGQFTSDIMQEVPSLKIIGNKISINKQDINNLSKFLDDMYVSDLAPSGRGVNKMPPRLRDANNNLLTRLLRSEKAEGGRMDFSKGGLAKILEL